MNLTSPIKTWLSWSSGKDSAWTFYQLMQCSEIELSGIFTTVNESRDRVAMHGTRNSLLHAQAKRLGVKLHTIYIPEPCTNEVYESAMQSFIAKAKAEQVGQMAFGDLYLEDIRDYRIQQMQGTGIEPIFPLWQKPTKQLAQQMIDAGIKAKIACVDTKQLPAEFIGHDFDEDFLKALPKSVDPCGENGEFHTFVYDAPMFDSPISIELGAKHQAGQFLYVDLK